MVEKAHNEEMQREYLKAVLSWLDAHLEREVYRWQLAGRDPSDRFRGLHISDSEILALSHRSAGEHWGSGIALPDSDAHRFKVALEKAEREIE